MRFSTAIFLALFAGTWVRANPPSTGFELQDQFGTQHQITFPQNRISVLLFADREGSQQLEGWVKPLYERYRDAIDIQGVARLVGVPPPLRPVIRAIFRRLFAHPVMMDWTGHVSDHFAFESGRVNLLVISPAGQTEYRINGPATPALLEQCYARIDTLLGASATREE